MSKKVAEQLIETIKDAGIKHIYAVTGDSLNEVNEAVRKDKGIKWIHVRHEEAGAYAALAEAELNGIACCAGSSGPGHVHLINGLYDAQRANASVLAIASTCPTGEIGSSFFQETNTIKLFDDCSGYNQIANTPMQFARMLQAALQHTIHKKEVAVLGLPGDLAESEACDIHTSTQLLPSKSVYRPQDSEIAALAELINTSNKVTIYCGIGAKDAHTEVVELSQRIKAPVGYSFRGKMGVQYDNPNEVGMTGLLGLPSAFSSMNDAELLILLGTDFPYALFMPDDCKIVQVDARPERIGRRAKVDMGLAGNVDDTLKALLPLIKAKSDDSFLQDQLKLYSKVKKNLAAMADKKGTTDNIAPEYVATIIDKLANNDAIFTVDTGMCCVWGARYLQATGNREMLGSFSHGSMANAMPMAIGAALARPSQQVIALCGDGGLSMMMGDLATIVEYKLPIKLVVFDNRSLGMVKLEMEVAGLPDHETSMYNPDFAAIAHAMGMKSLSVNDPDKVEETLAKAFAMEGPVLISVKTDPNALAMPPKIEFVQMKGFAKSMARLLWAGRIDEVWDTAKSNLKHWRDLV
ncbi:thiamine pyrophosphate-dependent enzyme [Dysgonomonas macrotermitis]|uniref:Pyruvate dehydrogenase (Quinone) n=1 Tax=Dysgonomonas macrotermitis TaxID=1346286 RepID=A0A1M4ZFZ9_9BACT|nr:thiamine pyrophosphate-dependent enzyme [Dysgonomonas macrotermitis]SHF16969.1 pyruvate dehydrogenase (quinone) [Dysgonomonas macrotermitis]